MTHTEPVDHHSHSAKLKRHWRHVLISDVHEHTCKFKEYLYKWQLYLRFMSRETVLEMGATRLLLLAWHVNSVCRCRRPSFSRRRTFCTRRSGTCSYESSSKAFSCHHVTLGLGRPASHQNGPRYLPLILKHKGTREQGHKDTRTQGHKGRGWILAQPFI
jgi:hypothetical protein